VDDCGISFDCSFKRSFKAQKEIGGHTRQGDSACDFLGRSNWGVVVRHAGGGGWWWSVGVSGVL